MEIARLQIAVDASQVPKGTQNLKALSSEARRTEDAIRKTSSAVRSFVSALAIGATISKVIAATVEQERVTAQLNATLKSTGRYTPELSDRLQAMAMDLQQVTTYGDESVIAMQSLLLTFTQIGGPEFDRAQMAILNVATAMGTDLKSAALQVGKALNDPILGVTALARSGIQFSESQKVMIKSLVETGQAAKAQGIILGELETQFGGSAEAARNTLGGALESLKNTFGDLLEGSGGNVTQTTGAINDLNAALSDPQIKAAFDTIVSGVMRVTTAVANVLPQLVGFTKWAGEELAVLVGGIGGHDIVRLEAQADKLTETLSKLQGTGNSGYAIYASMSEELDGLNKQIESYYQNLAQAPAQKAPGGDSGVVALIAETARETKKLSSATERLTKAQRDAIREQERMKAATQSNADVIGDLAEALYQATLPAAELAERQAVLRLNPYATPEQIASVRQLSAEMTKLSAVKEQQEELDRKREAFGSDVGGTIRGHVDPLSGGAFDDQAARYEAERAAEEMRYQEQLARLQTAKELEIEVKGGYYALEQQMAAENAARLDQIESARQSVMFASAEQGFGAMADITKNFAGEQSAAYKVMFATSKAFAIAQSMVAIQSGIAQAAATPWPLNLGAMASVTAATAGIVSNISAVAAPSFDGGGFTGGGARSGGLDGKGGFMAMLHPNETITDHTKGQQLPGGGGGTTQNVTFVVQGTPDRRTQTQIAGKMAQEQNRSQSRFG